MGLIDIVNKSGATLEGAGIVIEKGFQEGGKKIADIYTSVGFKNLSLRHVESQEATAIGQILQDQILAGFFLFGGIVKTSAEKALKQVAEYPNRYLKTLHPIR